MAGAKPFSREASYDRTGPSARPEDSLAIWRGFVLGSAARFSPPHTRSGAEPFSQRGGPSVPPLPPREPGGRLGDDVGSLSGPYRSPDTFRAPSRLSIRAVPRPDHGPQSREHRSAAGAQRDVE